MEKIVVQGFLYDFYGGLLTERQQEIYESYVYEDLSLSELAERFEISRQAVHDQLKRCEKTLQNYEEKLGMVEHFRKRDNSIKEAQKYLFERRDKKGEIKLSSAEVDTLFLMLELLKEGI